MVHRYSVSLYDEEIYQDDDGTFVYYFDYAALEQRFDALSTKFSAMVEENATLKKALDGLKQQLTAIGKVANFVLYKGEEAQKLAMEIENIIDPLYCPKCGACGEEGCCSPDRCIELPCLYGEHYLKSYKELEAENATLRKRLDSPESNGK